MTSREIIDGVMTSINAQIARRKRAATLTKSNAESLQDETMLTISNAQLILLERIEKDLIQVEMNAKISYMGIDVKGGEE